MTMRHVSLRVLVRMGGVGIYLSLLPWFIGKGNVTRQRSTEHNFWRKKRVVRQRVCGTHLSKRKTSWRWRPQNFWRERRVASNLSKNIAFEEKCGSKTTSTKHNFWRETERQREKRVQAGSNIRPLCLPADRWAKPARLTDVRTAPAQQLKSCSIPL